jgi:hypothetical protein
MHCCHLAGLPCTCQRDVQLALAEAELARCRQHFAGGCAVAKARIVHGGCEWLRGEQVEVYWPREGLWYKGRVTLIAGSGRKCDVAYVDGDDSSFNAHRDVWRLVRAVPCHLQSVGVLQALLVVGECHQQTLHAASRWPTVRPSAACAGVHRRLARVAQGVADVARGRGPSSARRARRAARAVRRRRSARRAARGGRGRRAARPRRGRRQRAFRRQAPQRVAVQPDLGACCPGAVPHYVPPAVPARSAALLMLWYAWATQRSPSVPCVGGVLCDKLSTRRCNPLLQPCQTLIGMTAGLTCLHYCRQHPAANRPMTLLQQGHCAGTRCP